MDTSTASAAARLGAAHAWAAGTFRGMSEEQARFSLAPHLWNSIQILDEMAHGCFVVSGEHLGTPPESLAHWQTSASLADAAARWERAHAWLAERLAALSEEDLARPALVVRQQRPLAALFDLVAWHDLYHAGQISYLRQQLDPQWSLF